MKIAYRYYSIFEQVLLFSERDSSRVVQYFWLMIE